MPAHVRRWLYGVWLATVLVPTYLFFVQGLGRTTVTAAAAWALAGPLLALALARDPEGRALDALRATGAGIRSAATAAMLLTIGMLVLPITLVAGGLLFFAVAAVALWALAGPSPRPARVLRRCATFANAALLVAVAAELVLRLPSVVAITCGHRPGLDRWERERYDRLWEHNELGMRSFHLRRPKPEGTQEILALGDEVTFGALIARAQDTWPYLLEQGFVREGRSVEVINAGRRGFTTVNEAEWLERVGSRFDPDLLVIQFGMNDTVPSYPNLGAEGSFWYFRIGPLLPVLHPYLFHRSYLYAALDAFKEHQVMRIFHPEGYLPLYDDGFEGWQRTRTALHAMAAWAKARGARVLLVLFPDFEPDTVLTRDGYRYTPVHEKVRRAAEAEGMDVLDLFPAIAAVGRPPQAWWPLPCEPLAGPEAQRIAAVAIRAAIDRELLLPPLDRARSAP